MKIALIEIGNSHDECLYTQIEFLRTASAAIDLTLICNAQLESNVKYFGPLNNIFYVDLKKGFKKWAGLFKIWRHCKKEKYDKIILNTAQGKLISRLLSFPYGKKTRFYGTLHDVKKLSDSYTQKKISKKLSHYFILNEYLLKNVPSGISSSVYYPVLFPPYPAGKVNKPKGQIWVAVPGQVELKRRDYKTLFESLKKHGIKTEVKFLFLGRYGHPHGSGSYVLSQIKELQLEAHFMLWEKFVSVEDFHSLLAQSDYILPLIHPGDESGNLYKNQITGAFNLAVGYHKPMLLEENIAQQLNFEKTMAYPKMDLMKVVNQLEPHTDTRYYQQKKWAFKNQQEGYLKALGS